MDAAPFASHSVSNPDAFPIAVVVGVTPHGADATSNSACPAKVSQIGRRMAPDFRDGTLRSPWCPASNQKPLVAPEPKLWG